MLFTTTDPSTAALADDAFPLIRAVLDRTQAGVVWTGTQAARNCAFVVSRAGYAQWLGTTEDHGFNARMASALSDGNAELPGGIQWYAPPAHWRAWLSRQQGVQERDRVRWRLEAPSPETAPMPSGLRLHPLTAENLSSAARLGLQIADRYWPSANAALAHGMGVCIVDAQDRVVACAYASCVANGSAEMDIAVDPSQRARRLGQIAGLAFMRACRTKGIRPSLDCFASNEPAMRLAVRLGFTPARRYVMASFGLPLDRVVDTQETSFGSAGDLN
jgi:GNAT superfamily N-acetyltransferase